MITITLTWPKEVRFDGGSFKPPTAEDMRVIARDSWAPGWKFSAQTTDRNELSFEVAHLRELMDRMNGIRRVFASFGVTPEIEVEGKPLLEFAWRQQVEKIHCVGLINQARKDLRRGHDDDTKAAIRVALHDGLNKPFAEIERDLLGAQ